MPKGSSASVFGGAGGRGTRASVATLDGLRNVMRNDPGEKAAVAPRNSAAAPRASAPPAAPVGPADDKKTMRGLNERLSGYLGRVRELEKANRELEDQIKAILAKRATPDGRNWDEIEKPLDHLRKKLKEKTMDNARLLLQIDNAKLANDDFKNKLDAEKQGRRAVEQDVVGLKKIIDDTCMNRNQLENQIESVKDELDNLKKDHKDEVQDLRKRIKDSNVIVEMDSHDSNLGETLNNIRAQYEKLAKKNRAEAENWYQDKFDNIKVEVHQNTATLQTGQSELNDLRRQKQQAEIDVQAMLSMIHSLEDTQQETENRYNRELNRLNQILLGLEEELGRVRAQVARQVDDYQELLHVKMKLEAEIENYRSLIHGITADEDSLEFSLEHALESAKTTSLKSKGTAPVKEKEVKEEAPIKPQSVQSNQAAPPAPEPQLGAAAPTEELKAASNGPPAKTSSSDSESEQKDK